MVRIAVELAALLATLAALGCVVALALAVFRRIAATLRRGWGAR